MPFADQLDAAILAHIRSGNADTTAAGLRDVLDLAADAIRTLEALARGAGFELQNRNPLTADGLNGDGWLNAVTGDAFRKEGGVWVPKGNLKGPVGTVTSGQNGQSAYALAVQLGYGGSEAQWLASLRGATGQSAYQAAVAGGFAGTPAQWLESLKGAPGDDGTDGNQIRCESFAPFDEAASVGDLWIHSISSSQFALYECRAPVAVAQAPGEGAPPLVVSNWRIRFTSPEPGSGGSGGGTAGVSSFNTRTGAVLLAATDLQRVVQGGTLSADGTKLIVGSTLTPEQDLSSNSTTGVPSVKAVKDAINTATQVTISAQRYRLTVTQTQNLAPIFFKGEKMQVQAFDYNFNVASVTFELSYLDANGDETKLGPFASFGGGSGLNSAINGLTTTVINTYGYSIRVLHTLRAGRSSAESFIYLTPVL